MTSINENLFKAIKGIHKNEPNKVSDAKLIDVDTKLATLISLQNGKEPKQPYPARMVADSVNGYLKYPGFELRYKCFDKDSNIYAVEAGIRLKKNSIEGAETQSSWQTIFELPDSATSGQIAASAIMVTQADVVVVCTQKGWVYTSDENQTNFTDTGIRMPSVEGQYSFCNQQFGYGHYNNLAWVTPYGEKPIESNKVYLSTDYGKTFSEKTPIPFKNHIYNSHIHDMQYDQFADRFWVVFGDQNNSQTYYSDDKCVTWNPLFGEFETDLRNTQMTSIAVFAEGVAFGSDHAPGDVYPNNNMEDNIRFLPRAKGKVKDIPDPSKLEKVFQPNTDNSFKYFAMKCRYAKVGNDIVTLMPWYSINPETVILTATVDGRNWYEIYKGNVYGSWHLLGTPPESSDVIYGSIKATQNGPVNLLKLPMPEWI